MYKIFKSRHLLTHSNLYTAKKYQPTKLIDTYSHIQFVDHVSLNILQKLYTGILKDYVH